MVTARIFFFGVIILLVGIQLRVVDTFVLTERATQFIESRSKPATPDNEYETYSAYAGYDPYLAAFDQTAQPQPKSLSPPRWLGWSFISVGAVLILTCPCFRR